MKRMHLCTAVATLTCFFYLLIPATGTMAQGVDLTGRPIAAVHIEGLDQVPEQLVRNAIRIQPGAPYDPVIVREDTIRITHLGRFKTVAVRIEPQADASLVLTYVVSEQMLIKDVQTVGNKALSDQELLSLVLLRSGDPVDQFLIDQGEVKIKAAYENKGYFLTDVGVDVEQLEQTGVLIFRVREGPRVRIQELKFEGNQVFSDAELRSKIRSKTYIPILRSGSLGREQLDQDAAVLREYYRSRGYLDAQVGRRIDLSNDQKDAVVVFLIDEGRLYIVEQITVSGNELFTLEQVLDTLTLKVGDVYSMDRVTNSQTALTDRYGKLGFIETTVVIERMFHEDSPRVDVSVRIEEGKPYTVGSIEVRGNQLTKSRVVLRQVRGMEPGRRFDRTGVELTERRLRESPLFDRASVTILGDRSQDVRDVLVEVNEKNTGSLSFGAGISSDAGVVGAIDLVQRNFDISDTPESLAEFFTGKAFRGAGQYFALSIQPGSEVSRYSVTFREPYLLDSNYFLDTTLFYFQRVRRRYDEGRFGGAVGLGQRFGDVWSAQVNMRYEDITIDDVDDNAPVDVFDVEGDSTLTSVGFSVRRNTTDSRIFPTRGSNWSAGISRAGSLGGDYDFTKISTEFDKYWTVDEDFLGRRTVFSFSLDVGYILEDDEAPVFERFYAGGHRTFRGFEYRGVGPRGIRMDTQRRGKDPVGGDFLFLLGLEYNFPIYQDIVRVVFFTDTGTVDENFSFSDYRVSVGAGLRLRVPFLGQAPFAFDLAIPVIKQSGDETQLFSFDIALPF